MSSLTTCVQRSPCCICTFCSSLGPVSVVWTRKSRFNGASYVLVSKEAEVGGYWAASVCTFVDYCRQFGLELLYFDSNREMEVLRQFFRDPATLQSAIGELVRGSRSRVRMCRRWQVLLRQAVGQCWIACFNVPAHNRTFVQWWCHVRL